MRLLYLVSAILLSVMVLVVAFAQVGATCTWYLIAASSSPVAVLIQMTLIGMIIGGLLVLLWKTPKPSDDEVGEKDIKTE